MLLKVENLAVSYGEGAPTVEGVGFELDKGEVLAIVGESGSGKTTVIRAILGVISGSGRVSGGSIVFEGRSLAELSPDEWLSLRGGRIAMIFQDTGAMLNPVQTIGRQFVEYLQTHKEFAKSEAEAAAEAMLLRMNLKNPAQVMKSYPFELSGGMRQRVGIAMALAMSPSLLLADEPTSALDVTTQAQIVEELMGILHPADKAAAETSMIMVTHNLGVAARLADKIMVMSGGRVIEYGSAREVLETPSSDYTKRLLEAVPEIGGKRYV